MSNNQHNTLTFETQLHSLDQHYVLCEPEQVQHLLRRDPSLVSLLLNVYPKLAAQFPDARVYLHAVANPEPYNAEQEAMDERQEIAAFISTSLEPKEAMKRLAAFYQSNWGQALRATQGKISIGLECL